MYSVNRLIHILTASSFILMYSSIAFIAVYWILECENACFLAEMDQLFT